MLLVYGEIKTTGFTEKHKSQTDKSHFCEGHFQRRIKNECVWIGNVELLSPTRRTLPESARLQEGDTNDKVRSNSAVSVQECYQ